MNGSGYRFQRYFYGTALTNYVMRRGVHYATYKLIEDNSGILVGVTRPLHTFDTVNVREGSYILLDETCFGDLLAQRTDGWVGSVHCCRIYCNDGCMDWTDWEPETTDTKPHLGTFWERNEEFHEGDTAGLLVDLNRGTLTVYKNNRRLGVAKEGLAGEYCFFASLNSGEEVSIKRRAPPQGDA